MTPLTMPPNKKAVTGFVAQLGTQPYDASVAVTDGSSDLLLAENGSEVIQEYAEIVSSGPGIITTGVAAITDNDSIGAADVTYSFSATMINPVPISARMYILGDVDSLLPIDGTNVAGFSMSCTQGCDSNSFIITYDSSTPYILI